MKITKEREKEIKNALTLLNKSGILEEKVKFKDVDSDDLTNIFLDAIEEGVKEEDEENIPDEVTNLYNTIVDEIDDEEEVAPPKKSEKTAKPKKPAKGKKVEVVEDDEDEDDDDLEDDFEDDFEDDDLEDIIPKKIEKTKEVKEEKPAKVEKPVKEKKTETPVIEVFSEKKSETKITNAIINICKAIITELEKM